MHSTFKTTDYAALNMEMEMGGSGKWGVRQLWWKMPSFDGLHKKQQYVTLSRAREQAAVSQGPVTKQSSLDWSTRHSMVQVHCNNSQ